MQTKRCNLEVVNTGLILRSQGGEVSRKTLFWLIVLAVALYGGYKLVPPSVSYYMMKTDVEEEAKIAHMYSDPALAGRILEKASSWSVPVRREDISISRGFSDITIEVRYTVEIEFIGGYKKINQYYISVSEQLKEGGRVLR